MEDQLYAIDADIPVPPPRNIRVTLRTMVERSSILVPPAAIKTARTAMWAVAKELGWRFTSRTMRDGQMRIWRLA